LRLWCAHGACQRVLRKRQVIVPHESTGARLRQGRLQQPSVPQWLFIRPVQEGWRGRRAMRMNRLSSPPQLRFSMVLFPACASHQEIQSMAADGLNLCCVEIILGGEGAHGIITAGSSKVRSDGRIATSQVKLLAMPGCVVCALMGGRGQHCDE